MMFFSSLNSSRHPAFARGQGRGRGAEAVWARRWMCVRCVRVAGGAALAFGLIFLNTLPMNPSFAASFVATCTREERGEWCGAARV